jgi:hypothetical protein
MKSSIFWDIMLCGPLRVNRCFGGKCRLHLQGRIISQERNQHKIRLYLPPALTLVSCFVYSSTLKMEETSSSEMLVDFQRTTRRYIPQGKTLQTNNFDLSTLQAHIQLPIRTPAPETTPLQRSYQSAVDI